MSATHNLTRFIEAREGVYHTALQEVKRGKKSSHWMWFIFPQISGLGFSETAKFYAIRSQAEAMDYLKHKILGKRLIEISTVLLDLQTHNPVEVFGSVDSMKLKSSMTLFSLLEPTDPVFQKVLDKFYQGKQDGNTLQLLNTSKPPNH
jgi:uncharacterized protein (DUF1810 family)